MKYLYTDLGEQEAESLVVVHLRGSWANVILVDQQQFARYRRRQPFRYTGGLQRRTPARIRIPRDGHWYLVLDCGGYAPRVRLRSVEVLPPDQLPEAAPAEAPKEREASLVGTNV